MTRIAARFVISASQPSEFPPPSLPEIAVVGRSNVGKSSLINALVGQPGLARTSRTPGRTRLINWFGIARSSSAGPRSNAQRCGESIDGRFHLVDLPGYGYAEVSRATRESWRPLIEGYLSERKSLAGVVLLIDIRRGAAEEEQDFVPWLAERDMPAIVALTKADKLAKNKRALEVARARRDLGLRRDPIAVSTLSGDGIEPLFRALLGLLAASP